MSTILLLKMHLFLWCHPSSRILIVNVFEEAIFGLLRHEYFSRPDYNLCRFWLSGWRSGLNEIDKRNISYLYAAAISALHQGWHFSVCCIRVDTCLRLASGLTLVFVLCQSWHFSSSCVRVDTFLFLVSELAFSKLFFQ